MTTARRAGTASSYFYMTETLSIVGTHQRQSNEYLHRIVRLRNQPAFFIFKGGKKVADTLGARSKEDMKAFIEQTI